MKLPKNPTVLQVAEKYRELGFVCIPVKAIGTKDPTAEQKKKGKEFGKIIIPCVSEWQTKTPKELFDSIEELEPNGIAIRCGKNEQNEIIICVDFDDYPRKDEFEKAMRDEYGLDPFQTTCNNGLHYFIKIIDASNIPDDFTTYSGKFKVNDVEFDNVEIFCHTRQIFTYPISLNYKGVKHSYKLFESLNKYKIPTNSDLENKILEHIKLTHASEKKKSKPQKTKKTKITNDDDDEPDNIAVEDNDDKENKNDEKEDDDDKQFNPDVYKFLYSKLDKDIVINHFGASNDAWKKLVLIAKRLWKGSDEGLEFIQDFLTDFYDGLTAKDIKENIGLWKRSDTYEKLPGYRTLKELFVKSGGNPSEIPTDKVDPEKWIDENNAIDIVALGNRMTSLPNDISAFDLYENILAQFSKHIVLHVSGADQYIYMLETKLHTVEGLIDGSNREHFTCVSWKESQIDNRKEKNLNLSKTIKYLDNGKKKSHKFELLKDWMFNDTYKKYLIEVKNTILAPGQGLIIRDRKTGNLNINIWQKPVEDIDNIVKRFEKEYTKEQLQKWKGIFRNHIFEVLADNNEKDYKYIKNTFIGLFNVPAWIPRACMVFKGAVQGTGKSLFTNRFMGGYFGKGFNTLKSPDFNKLGFAEGLIGMNFITFEEFSASDDFNYDFLKSLIEGGQMTVRVMYKESVSFQNYAKVIIFSNHDIPIKKKTVYDRRFAEFMVNTKYAGNSEYMERLAGMPCLFGAYYFRKEYLKRKVRKEFESFKFDHPKTAENIRLMASTFTPLQRCDLSIFNEKMQDLEQTILSKEDMYNFYVNYCNMNNIMYPLQRASYFRSVNTNRPCIFSRDISDCKAMIDDVRVPAVYLKSKKVYEEEFKSLYNQSPEDIYV